MTSSIQKYAKLLLSCGVNLQPGETLIIQIPHEGNYFVKTLVQEAYQLGAKYVHVYYTDDEIESIRYRYSKSEFFDYYPEFLAQQFKPSNENPIALLKFKTMANSDDYNYHHKIQCISAEKKATSPYKNEKHFSSCSAILPTFSWTKKLYPDVDEKTALKNLWDCILKITSSTQSNPTLFWKKKLDQIIQRRDFLQQANLHSIHFFDSKTNLTVKIPSNHCWIGGGEINTRGILSMPNFPTEEVFTSIQKFGVSGTLFSTKPFFFNNQFIEDISLSFENGKIVSATALTNEELLIKLLQKEEMCYCGEIAIVSSDNLLNQTQRPYYNTLLDENVGCHIALGYAYPSSISPPCTFSEEDYKRNQLNFANQHLDLVFGSEIMNVTGYDKENNPIPLLIDGKWVI